MANLPFFIDQAWDGATPVQVEMQILRLSDGATVAKKSWNFGKKPYYPTTITQLEGDEERSLGPGGSLQYTYIVGPAVGPDGIRRTYQNHTILERFEGVTCNIARTELKPEFQAAHPELMNSEQIARFFFDPASLNASFTLDVNGAMADLNGENHVSRAFPGLMAALTTMKEVHFDNAQVFEAQPGVPLGRYIIRRIVKPNGALAMRKFRA
jgi:hypothetical protein